MWRRESSWPYWDLNSDPLVVQPVASCFTDYAFPAPNHNLPKDLNGMFHLSHKPTDSAEILYGRVSQIWLLLLLFGKCWSLSSCSISVTLHCSVSPPHVKIVPLLDVHQLLMLFADTLTYSEPRMFSSIVFIIWYNCYYYYLHEHKLELNWIIIILFVCFLICINVFFFQCLPLITLWLYVVFLQYVTILIYTVLCL
jgi:hypothetical protein